MQPYFLPYVGYYQLISAVDIFIVYDDVQYTKKGWINRNRLLRTGEPAVFSLPLKSASDYLDIRERELAIDFDPARLVRQFGGIYRRAPHYAETMPLVERVMACPDRNLFAFVEWSIRASCAHLGIATEIVRSSAVPIDRGLRRESRVIALCRAVDATTYINPPGGVDLYDPGTFAANGVDLRFLHPRPFTYRQFEDEFVPWLSIVDVLMFNSVPEVRERIVSGFDLS
jgi:hypothetical protein